MQIIKFGGSSLASPQAMTQVLEIVKEKLGRHSSSTFSLVLSAMGGVTNQLQDLAALSYNYAKTERGERCSKLEQRLEPLYQRHLDTAKVILSSTAFENFRVICNEIFSNIRSILEALSLQNDPGSNLQELLLPQGELLSSQLFHLYLLDNDIDSQWFDSRDFIISKKHSDRTNIDLAASRARLEAKRKSFRKINVFPGFIAATPSGRTTVLGRNGSDYSATVLAYGLEADLVEIWTDVDGILTTDPRIVASAAIIPEMSIEEAMEMAYFGAKVIHAQTLLPIIHHPCPVRIRNTFNPSEAGTIIQPKREMLSTQRLLTAISYVDDASLLLLDGMFLNAVKFFSRVFQAFERHNVEPIMFIRVTADNKLCFAVYRSQIAAAIGAISSEFELELKNGDFAPPQEERDIAIISVIGEQMRGKIGTVGGIFSGLAKLNINILAIGQDITENNISFIIKQKDQVKTIQYLHQNYLEK